jgi:hypothetical protein
MVLLPAMTLPSTISAGHWQRAPSFTLAAIRMHRRSRPAQRVSSAINSNFADDFTVAVYAPIGCGDLTTTGQINIRPADGITPGNYVIQLVAQSKLHPELIQTATTHDHDLESDERATLDRA